MTLQPDYDVVIAGGGMTGASLAIALSQANIRVAMIEAVSPQASDQPSYDDRGLALTLSSQRILQGLGLWDEVSLTANPIQHVHVSEQQRCGFVRLHAEDVHMPALGYVVIARDLGRVLLHQVNSTKNINLICPATVKNVVIEADRAMIHLQQGGECKSISSRLLVAADGSHSRIRDLLGIKATIKDYGQTAVVTNVTPAKKHNNTAYERFSPQGPLALLPLTDNRCVVVFTVTPDQKELYLNMEKKEFLDHLYQRFGRRLGCFQHLGSRKSYPMQLIQAKEQVRERLVLLGNAVHTIHPNGAQGFNLCLRDVAGLAEVLIPAFQDGTDPGRRHVLNHYRDMRETDQKNVIRFTDGMTEWFYNRLPHRIFLRNTGMLFLDTMPVFKKAFIRRAMGLHGLQPALVRGVSG